MSAETRHKRTTLKYIQVVPQADTDCFYSIKNKCQNMKRPLFKTADSLPSLNELSSSHHPMREPFLLQDRQVQLYTMVLRSLASVGAFSKVVNTEC